MSVGGLHRVGGYVSWNAPRLRAQLPNRAGILAIYLIRRNESQ
jgi:hypothetical protein